MSSTAIAGVSGTDTILRTGFGDSNMGRGTSDLDAMCKDDMARTEGLGSCVQVRSNNANIKQFQ
jgi:hypothetical protein